MMRSRIVVGISFFFCLMIFTLSQFFSGMTKIILGIVGLYGSVALLPLFFWLILARPKKVKLQPKNENEPVTRKRKDEYPPPPPPKGKKQIKARSDERKEDKRLKSADRKALLPARDLEEPQEKGRRDPTGPGDRPGRGSPKSSPDRPQRNRPEGPPNEKQRPETRKKQQKAKVCKEECPRCEVLVEITDTRRPCKTRCPKCNFIIVTKN